MIRSVEPVTIMLPVTVAANFCGNCPEMKLKHRPDICVVPDEEGNHLNVRQTIECEHLYKCQNILQAKGEVDEPRK